MKEKRGQITIFIIVGLIIIGAVILYIIFGGRIASKVDLGKEADARSFLEACTEDKLRETVNKISLQGGYINNPLNKTFKFNNEDFIDISYLCYTQNYYVPCVNQEPVLIQHLSEEIKNYISDDVKNCFDDLTLNLEKQNYDVAKQYGGFEVELESKKIIIDINGEITLTKTGETSKQESFNVVFGSRFYDLAVVVQEIVSQEARFCNFEYLGYMTLYPQWNIDKFRTSDSTIIYTVEHKDTGEKFRFAIRGCVMPPGFG